MPSQRTSHDRAAVGVAHASKHLPGRAHVRSLGDRTLAWFLALLLCCTMLPLAAIASTDTTTASGTASAMPQDAAVTIDTPSASSPENRPPSEEADVPAIALPDDELTDDVGASGETADPDEGTSDGESGEPEDHSASFDRSYYASIAAPSFGSSSLDGDSGLCVGAVLRASVFRIANEETLSREEVADDGTFSYHWYACDARTTWNLSDKDLVATSDESSIALADDMVGKHLFVKVAASDGTTTMGPHLLNLPTGILRGIGPVTASSEAEPEVPGPADPTPEVPDVPEVPETPAGPDDPSAPTAPGEEGVELTATVTVTGTTRHQPGTSFFYTTWIPETEFRWLEDERITAWDAFAFLLHKSGYSYRTDHSFPSSITTPDGSYTLGMSAEGAKSYWAFYLDGRPSDMVSCDHMLRNGDRIELRFFDATSSAAGESLETYPQETTPEAPVTWGGFGSNGTGASTSLVTPTTDLSTGWTFDLSEGRPDASWSEPLIVNDRIYLATATRFCMMDRATGDIIGSAPLAGPVDRSGCQPVYANGKVVVPLASGHLQAFSISTLHCIWVSESLTESAPVASIAAEQRTERRTMSSLYARDGRLYAATASSSGAVGRLSCLDLSTGARLWTRDNVDSNFYWPGTAQLNGYILVSGENGMLEAIATDSTTGEAVGTLRLTDEASKMRSAVVQDDHAYCVSRDGVFHKVSVDDDGSLTETGQVKFASYSSSTPTVCNGMAFVGGGSSDGTGVLACIDTTTLRCQQVNGPQGGSLPAEVAGTPLVSTQPTGTFVYFTCNGAPGGVYLYKVGDASARIVYEPDADLAGSGIDSMVVGPDGRLYCVSASGQLIELKEQVAASVPDPTPGESRPGPTPDRSSGDSATLWRMMNAMEAQQTLLDVSPRYLGTTTGSTPTAPELSVEEEAGTAALRHPITSFIEDIAMHAQDVSLLKWMLFATGGLFAGGFALLAVILPLRARRNRL